MTESVNRVFGAARGEIDVSDDFDTVDDRIGAMFEAAEGMALSTAPALRACELGRRDLIDTRR